MSVTPLPASASQVVTGGIAVTVFPGTIGGGFIQNPSDDADQGVAAEPLYVNPVTVPGSAPGAGNGTTFVLYPGQSWTAIPGQTTPTYANASTSGHKFSAVYWKPSTDD